MGGDRIRSSRVNMSEQPGVVPMRRCLECRTRKLAQDRHRICRWPGVGRFVAVKMNVGTKCNTKNNPLGPKLPLFHRKIVSIKFRGRR